MPFVNLQHKNLRSYAESEIGIDVQRAIWRGQPDFWEEVVPAAFTIENTVGSLRERMKFPLSGNPPNPEFDAFNEERNRGTIFERFPELLGSITNAEDWEIIRQRAGREWQMQRLVNSSPWAFGAYLLAGMIDPVNLLPVGATTTFATRNLLKMSARKVAGKTLTRGLASGALGNAYAEIPLHASQELRTPQQAAMNIAAGTLLGGVIGTIQIPFAIKNRALAEIYAAFGEEVDSIRGTPRNEPILHTKTDTRVKSPESLITYTLTKEAVELERVSNNNIVPAFRNRITGEVSAGGKSHEEILATLVDMDGPESAIDKTLDQNQEGWWIVEEGNSRFATREEAAQFQRSKTGEDSGVIKDLADRGIPEEALELIRKERGLTTSDIGRPDVGIPVTKVIGKFATKLRSAVDQTGPLSLNSIEGARAGQIVDPNRPIIGLDQADIETHGLSQFHWIDNTRTTHSEGTHTTTMITASELLNLLPDMDAIRLEPPAEGSIQLRRPRVWVELLNPDRPTKGVAGEMRIVAFNEIASLSHLKSISKQANPRVPVEIVVIKPTKAQRKAMKKGLLDPAMIHYKKFPGGKVPEAISMGRLRAHVLAAEPNSIRLDRSITCASPCKIITNEDIMREGHTIPGGYHEDGTIGISAKAVEMDTTGAYNPDIEATEAEMKSAMGMEHVIGFMFPSIRMATSSLRTIRQIAPKLVNMDLRMEQFAEGTPRSRSAELGIKMWNRPMGELIEEQDQLWAASRAELAGRNTDRSITAVEIAAMDLRDITRGPPDGGLTKHQFFEEVGIAMRRQLDGAPGSSNKWVEQAAIATRKRNEQVFSAAEQVGLMDEILKIDPEGNPTSRMFGEDGKEIAQSHFVRVYKKQILKDSVQRQAFIRVVAENWETRYEMKASEALEAAELSYNHIMGTKDGLLPSYHIPGLSELFAKPDFNLNRKPGSTRPRGFDVHDFVIEPWLVDDVQLVTRHFFRTMIPDIEIARNFGHLDVETGKWKGDPNMTSALRFIADEIEDQVEIRTKRGDTKESIAAFEKRARRDREDLANLRDLLRGQFAVPANPEHGAYSAMQSFRMINYITMGGGFMLSSIPDISRMITVNGLAHTFETTWEVWMAPKEIRESLGREARLAGTAWETLLNQRAANIFDLSDDYARMTRVQLGLRAGADRFATLSLLSPWNDLMKRWSGIYSGQLMARYIDDWAKGRASPAQIEKLNYWGFTFEISKVISGEIKNRKLANNDLWHLETPKWKSREARDAFRLALVGEIDRTIITPGAADVPLLLNTEVGRTIFQFKRFALAATKTISLSGMQWRDMQALNGAMMAIAMGAVVAKAKAAQYGYSVNNTKDLMLAAVDRSGLLGILPDINKSLGLASEGALAPGQILFGGANRYKYTEQDFTDVLMGPTRGTIRNVTKAVSAVGKVATGQWDQVMETEIRAIARLSGPYSLFYLTWLYEKAIDGLSKPGVRARREKKKLNKRKQKADNASMIDSGEYTYLEMAYEDHGVDGLVSLVNERHDYRVGGRPINLKEQLALGAIIKDSDMSRIHAANLSGGIAGVVKYLKQRLGN